MKRVHTWKQLLADPRVRASEIWREYEYGGKDYWIPLVSGFNNEGNSVIHEWSKAACIHKLNMVTAGNPY